MNAEEFDQLFDEGVDMGDHLYLATLRRPNLEVQRITIELPAWMLQGLDRQAQVLGVDRDAVIKLWIAERLHRRDPIAAE